MILIVKNDSAEPKLVSGSGSAELKDERIPAVVVGGATHGRLLIGQHASPTETTR